MTDLPDDCQRSDLMADFRQYLRFSAEAYLANNSDVAEAGLDPFTHFVQFGRYERNRIFGFHTRETWAEAAGFRANSYLACFTDVAEASLDPLWHFCQFGFWEGRLKNRVSTSLVWEQLGVEPDLHTASAPGSRGASPSLDSIDIERARSTLSVFLRRGPEGLHGSGAAVLLGWLALTAGEPAVAEAFFETYRLGPPYFLKPGDSEILSVAAFPARFLREYCAERRLTPTKIIPSERIAVPAGAVLRRPSNTEVDLGSVNTETADIFAVSLTNVTAFPGQDFLISEDNFVIFTRENFIDARPSTSSELGNGIVAFAGGFAVVEWLGASTFGEPLTGGISLLGSDSRNLMNWVLNRLPHLRGVANGVSLPALIEPALPPQFNEWAKLALPHAELISMSAPRRVGQLSIVFTLEKSALSGLPPPSVLAWIKKLVADEEGDPPVLRLFLPKGFAEPDGTINRNSAVLWDELSRHGFVLLDPALTSVREQLAAVRKASIVVAEMGAALINLIACCPGTPVVVIGNQFRGDSFELATMIAAGAGCRVKFYKGLVLKGTHPNIEHCDYIVDVADCMDFVTKIME